MADGTAAATAYISVEAAGGTTLDGRTYKAYRLGSYGRTDVRVDTDSGDRYAASIPVSTDPDRADAVADAGSKAGFTGDDMLAAAWASTDSTKLEAFARGLASSLSDAEPAASVEGAGRMGPFTPGVYLVSGSDGSACLTGTLPSEGVGDRSHVLGIAEFEGDAYALPSAGTYWMVRVSGGADKASVTVSGSNAEAKALLKGLDGSTVTVGDRLEGNIMPPMTGGRYDVARAGALAGVVTLGLLIAGCVFLRRRNTSPLDR